jgi:hypothetical protein
MKAEVLGTPNNTGTASMDCKLGVGGVDHQVLILILRQTETKLYFVADFVCITLGLTYGLH